MYPILNLAGEFGIVFKAQLLNVERWINRPSYPSNIVAVKTLKGIAYKYARTCCSPR